MGQGDGGTSDGAPPRRRFLRAIATGGTVATGALAGCDGIVGTPTRTPDSTVTFLLSTAESGQYEILGSKERRGFEMAVRHLNDGGGLVDAGVFEELSGTGVLGRIVDPDVVDSGTDRATTRSNVTPYLDDESAALLCGGISGAVVREHRDLASEYGVPYAVGASLLSEIAGEGCSSAVFRECYTSDALARALGPHLAEAVGTSASYYHLYTDAPEGVDLRDAFNAYFNRAATPDWRPRGGAAVTSGSRDFASQLSRAETRRPDVLFLDLFGLDAVNALASVRSELSADVTVVVPYLDDDYATSLVGGLTDVVGTTPWTRGVDSATGIAYETAYRSVDSEGHVTGAGTAHVTYVATLQFAAAAERAGSFDLAAVRPELESLQYDVGLGSQRVQQCNHQSTRPVPVVRGRADPAADDEFVDLVALERDATAGCGRRPASDCSL